MARWQRMVFWVLLVAGVTAIVWLLAPKGQRAIPALTAVLVGVTAWYADRTNEMVREMPAARAAQVRPNVIASMHRIDVNTMTPKVLSVGPGAAFDVKVTLTLEPAGPSAEYAAAVLLPGRSQVLLFYEPGGKQPIVDIDEIGRYDRAPDRKLSRCSWGGPQHRSSDRPRRVHSGLEGWRAPSDGHDEKGRADARRGNRSDSRPD